MFNSCEKCREIQAFAKRQLENPPVMPFEVEKPLRDILEKILEITEQPSETQLERLARRAAATGDIKDLRAYLKKRRNL